jgi:hypothetical protein
VTDRPRSLLTERIWPSTLGMCVGANQSKKLHFFTKKTRIARLLFWSDLEFRLSVSVFSKSSVNRYRLSVLKKIKFTFFLHQTPFIQTLFCSDACSTNQCTRTRSLLCRARTTRANTLFTERFSVPVQRYPTAKFAN